MIAKCPFPAVPSKRKLGTEKFTRATCAAGFDLIDFWQWSASDLVSNATRGILAEFLVAQALGLTKGVRAEWDSYDLQLENGLTIEVKSAAYLQSWAQTKLSPISFGIAPTKGWDPKTNEYDLVKKRQADLYVFCLLKTKVQNQLDPLDLDQWEFYVLPTKALNDACPNQKHIGLNRLLRLKPVKCRFEKLRKVVMTAKIKESFKTATEEFRGVEESLNGKE
jgi:hypothetical protein